MTDMVKPGHPGLGELSLPGMTTLAVTEVMVDDTATGKTLAALLAAAGGAIHADVRRVSFIPSWWWGDIPYWSFAGDAVAGVNPMWWGGALDCRADEAAQIKFITDPAGTAAVTVVQEG